MSEQVGEATQEATVKVEEKGHPETVSWTQYVGIKEKLGKTEEKMGRLEEQIKNAVSGEEHAKVKEEYDKLKATIVEREEQQLAELRKTLIDRGVSEEKLKGLSAEAMGIIKDALGQQKKPLPDLGSGAGVGTFGKTSPMELARQAYGNK